MSRCRVPVGVEATKQFIEILDSRNEYSVDLVKGSLCMALIRFVNGILDQQQKQAYAQSISRLAENIQFPRWLVDLRHEATHTAMPSLELVTLAAEASLEWLRETYWEVQLNFIPNLKSEISSLLSSFKEQRKDQLRKGKEMGQKIAIKIISQIENIQTSEFIRRIFIEEMLYPGFLLPKKG